MFLIWVTVLVAAVLAQQASYTDANTGISFWEENVSSEAGTNGLKFGIALPASTQTQYQDEYIGHLVIGLNNGAGWAGGVLSVDFMNVLMIDL